MGKSQPSCFNCDHAGGGMYREHEGVSNWFMGLTANGQAHFACDNCYPSLYDVHAVDAEGNYDRERDLELKRESP